MSFSSFFNETHLHLYNSCKYFYNSVILTLQRTILFLRSPFKLKFHPRHLVRIMYLVLNSCSRCNTFGVHLEPGISKGPSSKYVRKIFRNSNISNSLIRTRTCAHQGVRIVSFSKNVAYVLNG